MLLSHILEGLTLLDFATPRNVDYEEDHAARMDAFRSTLDDLSMGHLRDAYIMCVAVIAAIRAAAHTHAVDFGVDSPLLQTRGFYDLMERRDIISSAMSQTSFV